MNDNERLDTNKTDIQVQEAIPKLKEPSLYKVILYNDDFTPMEFVIAILELFFCMERALATKITYEVHMTGKGICGVYTKDVAETKADQVMEHARRNEYPLLCTAEVM